MVRSRTASIECVRRGPTSTYVALLFILAASVEPSQSYADQVASGQMAGIVQDEDGKPVAGVTVDAWHWYSGNESVTDDNGRFTIKDLDPKRKVEVLVSKEGFCPQHYAQRPVGEKDWVIVLNRKTYFDGTVIGSDGKPVAHAEIRASFGPVHGDGVLISEVATTGKAGPNGEFRLYVMPETYDIQISGGARGVLRKSGVAIKSGEAKTLPVNLEEGVRFQARVVDSQTNTPVEGFVLWRWQPPYLAGRSSAAGLIEFEGLVPGSLEFSCGGGEAEVVTAIGSKFYKNGPFGRWWSADAIHAWEHFQIDEPRSAWQRNFDSLHFDLKRGMAPVTIVVEKGVTVTGKVTDPQGNPVSGATVAPARTGSGNSLTGDTRYSVSTEKDGTYSVVLPASNQSTYNLVAHDGKFEEWRHWANGVSQPIQTNPGQVINHFDLQLTEPAIIRGRVLVNGRGVGHRDVRTHAFDKLENRYYDPTTQTKDDGTFELRFVRPGKHYLQAEPFWLKAEDAPGGSKIVEVKAGETLNAIELIASP